MLADSLVVLVASPLLPAALLAPLVWVSFFFRRVCIVMRRRLLL